MRLHGRVEVPESLVFADRHYRTLPERESYVEFFRQLFVNRNLVFFGFSFDDPVISELIGKMAQAVRSQFRREAYALVADPPSKLVETLRAAGIVAVPYPSSDHEAAWKFLAAYRTGEPPIDAEQFEVEQMRSHLATAYARAKGQGDQFSADRERILSALMMPVLAEYGSNTIVDVDEFLSKIDLRLALPRHFKRGQLVESLKLLERDGLVVFQGSNLLIGELETPQELAKDANRLVDGLIARAKIRLSEFGLESQRPLLDQLILAAMALDGLHLAHTLIRRHPLDSARLELVVAKATRRVKIPQRYLPAATDALTNLISSPDPEEELILTNIAAVVFGTTLLLADPLLADRVANPFKQRAYVDASVLLPWIAEGHPLRQAYDSVLKSFDLSNIRVLAVYLNEIVSHKRLALESVRQGGLNDPKRFRRYASLFELHNINVFMGGYAGSLERAEQRRLRSTCSELRLLTTKPI